MPPRIRSHQLTSASAAPTFRTRPQCLCEARRAARQLHATARRRADDEEEADAAEAPAAAPIGTNKKLTSLQRAMFAWLNGPGKVFRKPASGRTNYLTAYDHKGQLRRLRTELEEAAQIEVISEEEEPELQAQEEKDGVPEAERAARLKQREELRAKKAQLEEKLALKKERERGRDLQPFPQNPDFRSEAVLSEELRAELYRQVVERGIDVTTVSAAYGVDIRRVAAVVRLMTIEKQWKEEGKPLARAYGKAVLDMLPKTPFKPDRITPHESINDLPVHPHTRNQLFVPVSESRRFTREDAAAAFSSTLLPADQRIPHPELIVLEREHLAGVERNERIRRQAQRDQEAAARRALTDARQQAWHAKHVRVVPGRRWDFEFEDISAEKTGRDGRGAAAVGVRYGVPHMDRKKNQVKIPTKVE